MPPEETRRQERSQWSKVLHEMSWTANDFHQERVTRKATLTTICSAIVQERLRRPPTKAAQAVGVFWQVFGRDSNAISENLSPAPTSSTAPTTRTKSSRAAAAAVAAAAASTPALVERSSKERLLQPMDSAATSIPNANKLQTLLQLDRSFELRKTQEALVVETSDFTTSLSPVQSNSLRRLGVVGKIGLGALLCDSRSSEHRLTIAAFLARLRGDLAIEGPYLVVSSNERDLTYIRAFTSLYCPQLNAVTWTEKGDFQDTDVVLFTATDERLHPEGDTVWGAISLFFDENTLKARPNEQCSLPKPRWGGPVLVHDHDFALLEKSEIKEKVALILELPAAQLNNVLASPPSEEHEGSFMLIECLVGCVETADQRAKRKAAGPDNAKQELAAISADTKGNYGSAWGLNGVPPPSRASGLRGPVEVQRRPSGKFDQALSLIRWGKSRRALILSSRRGVLDAFFAFSAPYVDVHRFYTGTKDWRISEWMRFIKSRAESSCILSTFADLDEAPGREFNAAIDAVILLDAFTNENEVNKIKATVTHALVYRLYTRLTIEQHQLHYLAHPCLTSSSSNVPPHDRTELRACTRSYEWPPEPAVPTVTSATMDALTNELVEDGGLRERIKALRAYARRFYLGLDGSKSIFADENLMAVEKEHDRHAGTILKANSLNSSSQPSLHFDMLALGRQKVATSDVFPTSGPRNVNGPMDAPVYVVSFGERRPGSQQARKRSRLHQHHVDTLTMLEGGVAEEHVVYAGSNPPPPVVLGSDIPFLVEEDAFIKSMIESGITSAQIVAEALNADRLQRTVPDHDGPPPPRTFKEVAERIAILQRVSERRERYQMMEAIAASSIGSGFKTTGLLHRIKAWRVARAAAAAEEESSAAQQSGDLLQSVTSSLATRPSPASFIPAAPNASRSAPTTASVVSTTEG